MNGHGYTGQREAADSWNRSNASTVSKMEHTFWVTKQSVFRKFGKKEDECIVASDAELDAKLELFRSVQETCLELQRILDKYQERLCNLAQEESAMGRFLKECSKRDQTNAGKAMVTVGRALSYSGQQRLALRVPLQRLYQEVETFRQRAIEDTLLNVTAMERQRTEYRAALSWMKNISQELDPDTHKQLDKFRKVQGQVRQSKANFDRLKLDCLQKVDLLAAARCNMFSHALTLYQQSLIQHARRAHRAFGAVAKDIKGYQHYEFSVVPELTEESSRLAQQSKETDNKVRQDEQPDSDELLCFDTEYHDKADDVQTATEKNKSGSLQNLLNNAGDQIISPLIPLESSNSGGTTNLTELSDVDLMASDCLNQLDDILGKSFPDTMSPTSLNASDDWASLFRSSMGDNPLPQPSNASMSSGTYPSIPINSEGFLPSQLLDSFASTLELQSSPEKTSDQENANLTAKGSAAATASLEALPSDLGFMSSFLANLRPQAATGQTSIQATLANSSQVPQTPGNQVPSKMGSSNRKDMSAWYDLFADLDPLANPDALDSKTQEEERNC